MSTGNKDRSNKEHHQQAAELHNLAAHAHFRAAESHGKQDHLTGNERSRQALEHSQRADQYSRPPSQGATKQNGYEIIRHQDVAALAHSRWHARGCPLGSPEEDWQHAEQELRVRTASFLP